MLKQLQHDELIPKEVQDITEKDWQDCVSPDVKAEQDAFLELAEQFKESLNKVILPIRLGIYALYSIKKVSIFNKTIVQILEWYVKHDLFK